MGTDHTAEPAGSAPAFVEVATLYDGLSFPSEGPGRPYVAVNMVSTVDGKAVVGGRAASVGGSLDRRVLRRIRAAADAVLNGAGTIRAEGFAVRVSAEEAASRASRGLRAQPLHVILTNSADLPIERRSMFRGDFPRPLIVTSKEARRLYPERIAALERVATVELAGEAQVELPALLRLLGDKYAVRRLVLEGGPRLNQQFFAAGLVDELFLTIAARVVGGASPTIVSGDSPSSADLARLRLVSVAATPDELFLRYRVPPTVELSS